MNYIGKRGYTIYKNNLNEKELKKIKKELFVKPYIPTQFSNDSNNTPFPVYLESKKKIYVPKFYGINKFGEFTFFSF